MIKKFFICLSLTLILVFGLIGALFAKNNNNSSSNTLMDYVLQEFDIYDSRYSELNESDCRSCHGNNLADTHHSTPIVVDDHNCLHCHGISSEPPGVIVVRDCLTSDCHSSNDIPGECIAPNYENCSLIVTLRGKNFNGEQYAGYMVQVKKDGTSSWMTIPTSDWKDNMIELMVPCWILNGDNYKWRVVPPANKKSKRKNYPSQ